MKTTLSQLHFRIILCGIIVFVCIRGTEAGIVFQDDFAGTAIDTNKWDVSVVMHWDPETPAPQYGSYGQDEHLWFDINTQNIARGQAITRRTFTEQDNVVEVEVWQDNVSGWQDWPISLVTHLGSFGYYNYQWGWTAQWVDSQGQDQKENYLTLPAATPGTKIQDEDSTGR